METIGIEKLKKAIGAVISLGITVEKALADEKITNGEWARIGFDGIKFALAVKDFKALKAEWKDLDDTEKAELKLYVETKFDIQNDEVENIIKEVFAALLMFAGGFGKAK